MAVVVKLPPAEVVNTTVLPGVAVPETVLVAAGCVVLFTGDRIAMVGGATTVKLFTAGVLVPPTFEAIAVTLPGPAANVRLEQA